METEEHQAMIICYDYINMKYDEDVFNKFNWELFIKYFRGSLYFHLYSDLFTYYNPKIHCNKLIDELVISLDKDNIKIAIEMAKTLYK